MAELFPVGDVLDCIVINSQSDTCSNPAHEDSRMFQNYIDTWGKVISFG